MPHSQTHTPREPMILVVDDVEANRNVVCRRLEGTGYRLVPVESGERALRAIQDDRPDLVLLDYMMPTMSGIEVLKIVREDWGMNELPIIMLTARAEAEAVVTALEAGADDFVSKPIDFDVLKARIETQLTKVKSNQGLRMANAALDERVAMRVLAFDKLREEVEREITLRKKVERELEQLRGKSGDEGTNAAPEGIDPATLQRVHEILDTVIRSATDGKPVNLALLKAMKSQLSA
ncbi:MAG: response regulator [Proteobacteria bacterium]|nr:response regulator [Pseudomonadota bacterium]